MDYTNLAQQLIDLQISREHISFDREMSKAIKGELFVLNFLKNHGNKAHPRELSEGMLVSTARTAVILNHLEKEGLIKRIHDSSDNRQVNVVLSEKGIEFLDIQRTKALEYVTEILAKLGREDAENYIRIQKKLLNFVSI